MTSPEANIDTAANKQFRSHIRASIVKYTKKGWEDNKHPTTDAIYEKVAEDNLPKLWHWIPAPESIRVPRNKWMNYTDFLNLKKLEKKPKKTRKEKTELKKLKLKKAAMTKAIQVIIRQLDIKDKANRFEADILKFMETMGFQDRKGTEIVHGDGIPFKLYHPASRKGSGRFKEGTVQIDAIGRWGNTIFVVECKRSDTEDSTYPATAELSQLRKTMDKLELALKQTESDRNKKKNKLNASLLAETDQKKKDKIKNQIKHIEDTNEKLVNVDWTTSNKDEITKLEAKQKRRKRNSSTWKELDKEIDALKKVQKDWRLQGVFALNENIKVKNGDERDRALRGKKFLRWDSDFRTYYAEDLHPLIDEFAIYDMLGEMGIKNDDPHSVSVWALRTKHPKFKTIYQFLIDPREILKISSVARRNRPGERYYQRKLQGSKLEQIRIFYSRKGIAPSNIILACEQEHWTGNEFSPVDISTCAGTPAVKALLASGKKEKKKSRTMHVEYGVLTFPREYRSCWVIDGQHRLYGMAKLGGKPPLGELRMPIIAFAELDEIMQGQMFLDINTTQTPISGNLKYDLWGDYEGYATARGTASNIAKKLESQGALKDRIYYPLLAAEGRARRPESERIGIAPFCNGVEKSRLLRKELRYKKKNPLAPSGTEPTKDSSEKRRKNWYGKISTKAVTQIDNFYDKYAETYPNELVLDRTGESFLYASQAPNALLPLLSEILSHAKHVCDKPNLVQYINGLARFQEDADISKTVRTNRIGSLARANLADDVIEEMCISIRDSGRKFRNFAKDRLEKHAKEWDDLSELFGYFFNRHFPRKTEKAMPEWKKSLSPTLRKKLEDRADDKDKADEEYQVVELQDVAHILRNQTILVSLADKLKNNTPHYRNMSTQSIRDLITANIIKDKKKDGTRTLLGEWNKIRNSDPPDDWEQAKGIIKSLIRGISQLDLVAGHTKFEPDNKGRLRTRFVKDD